MHLYQAGMDLTLVSQWLGHSNISTTLVYAHADTEQKRKAIEAATPPNSPLGKSLNPARFTVTDEELLKKLTGLRRAIFYRNFWFIPYVADFAEAISGQFFIGTFFDFPLVL